MQVKTVYKCLKLISRVVSDRRYRRQKISGSADWKPKKNWDGTTEQLGEYKKIFILVQSRWTHVQAWLNYMLQSFNTENIRGISLKTVKFDHMFKSFKKHL